MEVHKKYGKYLVPICFGSAHHNDIRYCTCTKQDKSFGQFEKEEYKAELLKLQIENKSLDKEANSLRRVLQKVKGFR